MKHFNNPKQMLGDASDKSDFDSDLEDVDLNRVFDHYDVMTPNEKLMAIRARAKKLKERT